MSGLIVRGGKVVGVRGRRIGSRFFFHESCEGFLGWSDRNSCRKKVEKIVFLKARGTGILWHVRYRNHGSSEMGKMRRVNESDEMICKYIEEKQKKSRGNGNHELKK